jgi:hypothetical protein
MRSPNHMVAKANGIAMNHNPPRMSKGPRTKRTILSIGVL